jgi:hypothetical protein
MILGTADVGITRPTDDFQYDLAMLRPINRLIPTPE